jgi:hypothetical protein
MTHLFSQPLNTAPPLTALVYVSRSSVNIDPVLLDEIATTGERNNQHRQITGLLLSKFGLFMQYLEGPTAAVERLLAHVGNDIRHHSLMVLHQSNCETRLFPDWGMRSMNFQGLEFNLRRDYYNPYLIFLLSFIEETTNYTVPITLKTDQDHQEYLDIVEELLKRAMKYCQVGPETLQPDSDWDNSPDNGEGNILDNSRKNQIITPLRDAQSITRLLGNALWGLRLVDLQLQFAFASAEAQQRPLPTPFSIASALKTLEQWQAKDDDRKQRTLPTVLG